MLVRLACLAIGYVFGLFQTSYIYGRMRGIDIREHGSGNAGATNAMRTLGKGAGLITFAGDCLKCVLAVLLVRYLWGGLYPDESIGKLFGLYAAFGVILGHNFPFYLKFHGGKGISATAGLYISLSLPMSGIGLVLFLIAVIATRYVSVGSLVISIFLPIGTVIFGQLGLWNLTQAHLYEMYVLSVLICALAVFQHRKNIKRLMNGTESKIGDHAD